MAEIAQTLIDASLQRARDPDGLLHTRVFTLSIISEVQRLINGQLRVVIDSAVMTTDPEKLLYSVNGEVPNAIRINGVRDGSRNLTFIPWETLVQGDPDWFRRIGEDFESWSMIGRDILVVYPAKLAASSVTVFYTKLTNDLVAEATATEMDDDHMMFILDVTEAVLLTRARDFVSAKNVINRVNARMGVPVG